MPTITKQHRYSRCFWIILPLHFLFGGSVSASSLSPTTQFKTIISTVGNQTVLPCSWKAHVAGTAPTTCHIIWATSAVTVLEMRGEQKWEAKECMGRVEVPEERLVGGDCSLIIRDVQIADWGRYESFMVLDGPGSRKTRVFIQAVWLSVLDHKSSYSRLPGEDFDLDLYTSQSVRVTFQGRNSSELSDLWMRGDEDTRRVEKHPLKEQLTIKTLKRSDEGIYKVYDHHGFAVSTVQLSVEGNPKAFRLTQALEDQLPRASSGKTFATISSAVLIWSVLVTTV